MFMKIGSAIKAIGLTGLLVSPILCMETVPSLNDNKNMWNKTGANLIVFLKRKANRYHKISGCILLRGHRCWQAICKIGYSPTVAFCL
jgi:hypothetical protein